MVLNELLKKIGGTYSPLEINKDTTALVLIDMQVLALSDYLVWEAKQVGIDENIAKNTLIDYDSRFKAATDKAKELLNACRQNGIRPIHVKIESYSGDACDTGPLHKSIGFLCPPSSEWSKWIEDVKPVKNNSSAWHRHRSDAF